MAAGGSARSVLSTSAETVPGQPSDAALLESLARGMAPGKTICALSDAAAIPTLALVRNFRAELEQHAASGRLPEGCRSILATKDLQEAHA